MGPSVIIGKTIQNIPFATTTALKEFQENGGTCFIHNNPGLKKITLKPEDTGQKLFTVTQGIINKPLLDGIDSIETQFVIAIMDILKNPEKCEAIFKEPEPQLLGSINISGPLTVSDITLNNRHFLLQQEAHQELFLHEEQKPLPPPI